MSGGNDDRESNDTRRPVNLGEYAELKGLETPFASVADIINGNLTTEEFVKINGLRLQGSLQQTIQHLFIISSVTILILVVIAVGLDIWLLLGDHISPGERIITTEVMMTLIAATTAQLGAAFFLITQKRS